jgi:hypothetical protein
MINKSPSRLADLEGFFVALAARPTPATVLFLGGIEITPQVSENLDFSWPLV